MKYLILTNASQRDFDGMAGATGDGTVTWTGEQVAEMAKFMAALNSELAASGELVETRGLAAPVHTRRVRVEAGVPVVTDGPYPETQEVLAGYWVVECDSFDRATEIAARFADCPNPGGLVDPYVDVRPIMESADELRP